ncbi:plasmid transfer protein TraA [Kutzneria chonburiensis]|uniref:Plasmid transfer protein TraA n=1 Tax=Kutzneria chonburiensis TaxID=1483604 RepID=A0ABV6MK46_9PSEU|nr:plasmid transfer protein TraA [Kutzneria chonburiensis]
MAQNFFGEPEFYSSSQIRDYCNRARLALRPLHNELHISAEELQAVLKHVSSANPQVFGLDSRFRAKLVAKHMHHAADAIEVATVSIVRCYASFRQHYVKPMSERDKSPQRRQFDFDA